MPDRIQIRRDRPWQTQPKALKVDRSTGFGNFTTEGTAAAFAQWLEQLAPETRLRYLAPLRGRSLACWCPPTSACHADVLLDWANR